MKISNIEELMSTTDGNPYWVVSFEGKKMTFTDWNKPTYLVGDELPYELELVKPEGRKWYWKKKGTADVSGDRPAAKPTIPKPPWKPTRNDDAILQAVAFKGAIELEKHHYVPEGKVDTDRVLRSTRAFFDGLKKMLAEEEK